MEQVIKIQSVNAFSDNTIDSNTNFANSHDFMTQTLVDFKIPQGGVYDLTKSSIALNIRKRFNQTTADVNPNGDAVYKVFMIWF